MVYHTTYQSAHKTQLECEAFYGLPFIVCFCTEGHYRGSHYHVVPVRSFSTVAGRQTHDEAA